MKWRNYWIWLVNLVNFRLLLPVGGVEYTNEYILKFSNALTEYEINQIAIENGFINKGRVQDTLLY